MSESKFTKGPWEVNTLAGRPNSEVFSGDDVLICDCRATNVVMEPEEIEANAHLIAAAPDMYEALKRVMENKWEPDKYLLNVLQAIDKAEGRQ
jgi:hypothetical protein